MARAIISHLILRPLILIDRMFRKWGLKPDHWYWADKLAVSWGYFW